jgi:hypothetical protein
MAERIAAAKVARQPPAWRCKSLTSENSVRTQKHKVKTVPDYIHQVKGYLYCLL